MKTLKFSKKALFATLVAGVLTLLVGPAWAGPAKTRVVRVSKAASTRTVHVRRTRKPPVKKPETRRTKLKIGSHRPTRTVRMRGGRGGGASAPLKIMGGLELGGVVYGDGFVEEPVLGVRFTSLMPDSNATDALWLGAYGRLQLQPESDITRTAAGMTASYLLVTVEAGIVAEHRQDQRARRRAGARLGGEISMAVGLLDSLSLYSRLTQFNDGEMVEEAGLRLNLPL